MRKVGLLSDSLRTGVVLFLIAECNVIWSYIVMHLRMFTPAGGSTDTVISLFFYIGYGVAAVALIAFPKELGRFGASKTGAVAATASMVIASTLAAFSFGQTIFDATALSRAGGIIIGIANGFAIAVVYLFVFRMSTRGTAIVIVLAAHIAKRALSAVFDVVGLGTYALLLAFALPLLMLLLMLFVGDHVRAPHVRRPQQHIDAFPSVTWLLLASIAFAMVGVDRISDVGIWIADASVAIPSSASVGFMAILSECALAVLFAYLTIRSGGSKPLNIRYQGLYIIVLAAFFVGVIMPSFGDMPLFLSECLLVSSSIYIHGMSWVVTFDCIRETGISPYRAIGVVMVVESLLEVFLLAIYPGVYQLTLVCVVFFLLLAMAVVMPLVAYRAKSKLELANAQKGDSGQRDLDMLLDLLRKRCRTIATVYGLSERETDVLVLLAQGRTRLTICKILTLSEGTIKTHITHIYTKMSINSQQELLETVYGDNPDMFGTAAKPSSRDAGEHPTTALETK